MFIVEKILDVVAPHYCMVCGHEGAVICDWCLPDCTLPLPERCYRCKTQSKDSRVCAKCRRSSHLKHVWVRTQYHGLSKRLIHDFKFERKAAAAEPIARLMIEALPYLTPETVITHVPTATSRVRRRGYDPAELIAKVLARKLGLRYDAVLLRVTQTRQVGSRRAERLKQMENAFRLAKPQEFIESTVLLIDDLTTTGATLEAAAKQLRLAGSTNVSAAVFAQK